MSIQKVNSNLYLIDLELDIDGFRNFISSWVFKGDLCFLVDVGPASTIEKLTKALDELQIKRLDYIFLTHIHLDHAGGIGKLVEYFPDTKVVCSERGIKHLVNPEKLWEGSKKALKNIALEYGSIKATPKEIIIPAEEFQLPGVNVIKTPGHAAHHVSYIYDNYLFAGEAGGVFHYFNNEIYLRPATPPAFFLEEAVESIDRLLKFGKKQICYGHFGTHENSLELLKLHRDQLFLWKEVISDVHDTSSKEEIIENCFSRLFIKDNLFMPLKRFDVDIIAREKYFTKNSIQGYLGYLDAT